MKIDASVIILGFTGSLGSGCSYISSMIPQISDNHYIYFKLSKTLRSIMKEEGTDNPTVKQLQDKGNELRRFHGDGYLVETLFKELETYEPPKPVFGIIIDGIKNTGEVELLSSFPNFFLFSVQAERDIRIKRCLLKVFPDEKSFLEADKRDELEDDSSGQQVKKCNYLSDIIIVNEENFSKASVRKKEDFIRDICWEYIKLIEEQVTGKHSPENYPSVDELCMTIAYVTSKSSSCLKRKVGAVIIDVDGNIEKEKEKEKNNVYPYIVSSGYNEVPLGSIKCAFHPEYQKCYRDFLQEKHAEKMNCCPTCGEVITVKTMCCYCKKELDRKSVV